MDKELYEFANDYTVISQHDYDALQYNDSILSLLITAIKRSAALDYSGDKITMPYGDLDAIIRTLLPDTYDEIITKLQADKQMEGDFGA